jgi:hypothetical protein
VVLGLLAAWTVGQPLACSDEVIITLMVTRPF